MDQSPRRLTPPTPPPDLTRAILARTSGDPCRRLEALACDFVDDSLDAAQARLVRLHLDHCEACSALVGALATLRATLPTLAQADPGPWFTQAVLRATRQYRPQEIAPPDPSLRDLWRRLMHRPRIALEAAYLGAAAGLMGVYLPTPLPDLALKVPALAQPLGDSAQQAANKLLRMEQRTAISLEQRLRPMVPTRPDPQVGRQLWRQASTRVHAWWQRLRGTQLPPPAPQPPPPANPG